MSLVTLTSFQRFELILIPCSFLFSQILVLLFGLNIIGSETWVIMGIPVLFGSLISIVIGVFLYQRQMVHDFKNLESLLRLIVFIGGALLIPLLLAQTLGLFTVYSIFSILSLIFSSLGGIMTISCVILLWHTRPSQEVLE
jgi:hypothetical protein